ncbi:FecCD family ABC transporter permease [Polycladidibacter hongkongensis]|uniref:FecCD family ABC transporter permease n=1 Tax=Polycladidibacter hongkongensis TaxID=1647556 RepID=UPI0008329703|nr:iron ABC transporter permease [Pseudovibrio hongkongensis]
MSSVVSRGTRAPSLRLAIIFTTLVIAVAMSSLWGLSVGAFPLSFQVVINSLLDLDGPQQTYMVMVSRLPRLVLALLCGAALAISGVIIQGIVRNPLASPKIIGINSGAAFAVCLLLALLPQVALVHMPLIAALGGALAAFLVLVGAQFRGVSPLRLALVGVAVGMLFDSGVDFYLVANHSPEQAAPMVWLTGSLWARSWEHVDAVWALLCVLIIVGYGLTHQLDLIGLGDDMATSLGQRVALTRLLLLGIATLLASISVGVVGVLGFVGLMAPHMAAQLVGGRARVQLPCAALLGMLLVILADAVGRAIAPPIEVSAGVLTALFGAPFFVLLMLKNRGDLQQ